MLILMNVIATLLILALLGLVASIVGIVLATKQLDRTRRKAVAMTVRPRDGVLEIAHGIQGRALIMANRAKKIAADTKTAADAVADSYKVVSVLVAETVEGVDNVRSQVEKLGNSFDTAEESFKLFQQLSEILRGQRA